MIIKKREIARLARKLALFSDPVRLYMFLFLFGSGKNNLCVSDVARFLKSSISNVSHQLRKLELVGAVEAVRHGRMVCYRVKKTKENKILYNYLTKLSRLT